MLVINNEQKKIFEKYIFAHFEDEMVIHIKNFFPIHFKIMGEAVVREAIKYIYKRGKRYGFTTKRNACLYIGIAFMLGSNFDRDSQYPWATKILNDESIEHPVIRIDRLDEEVLSFLDLTSGRQNEHFQFAVIRFLDALQPTTQAFHETEPVTNIMNLFERTFPQKFNAIPGNHLLQLIHNAIHSADRYNLLEIRGSFLFATLCFLLGTGCDKDPQFPWISAALNSERHQSAKEKTDQLWHDTAFYLSQFTHYDGGK